MCIYIYIYPYIHISIYLYSTYLYCISIYYHGMSRYEEKSVGKKRQVSTQRHKLNAFQTSCLAGDALLLATELLLRQRPWK